MTEPQPQAAPTDRYTVMEYLAEGGMGAIYLGKKLGAGGFEKQVVLKQLLPEFTRQPEFIDLFLREARLSASLDHANIIHTIDLVTAGEEYFIVMEYLDGADLRTLTRRAKRRRKQLAPGAGIYIAREVLSALSYAHGKASPDGSPLGLIHRDVSPSNVLISGTGDVKLTDFGIAKASTHNSIFYRVKGKVGYMSPEQARSEALDHRSDLYSLAVCLFEMLTGERLFVDAGLTTSADDLYAQPVPAVSSKVPGLPAELDELMFRALSIDPDQRFQTAGEFQESLLRCAHRHQLLMSGPELADHLREACGSPNIWRDDDNLGDDIGAADREGTEELALGALAPSSSSGGEAGGDAVLSAAEGGSSPIDESRRRNKRAQTSVTKLSQLQGIELTSLIKAGPEDDDAAGAKPLVNIEELGQQAGSTTTSREFPAASPDAPAPVSGPAPSAAPGPSGLSPSLPSAAPASRSAPGRGTSARGSRAVPVVVTVGFVAAAAGLAVGIGFTGPSFEIDQRRAEEAAAALEGGAENDAEGSRTGQAGDSGSPAEQTDSSRTEGGETTE